MRVVPFEDKDRNVFLKLCEEFYNSGATARPYDYDIACRTYDYLMSKHENLWGYLLIDKTTDEPVGYALITSYWCNEDGGNVIILDELYIIQHCRHHGFGKIFLEWIENEFKGKAISITLEVVTTNLNAKSFYAKLGYAEDGFEVLTKKL